MGSEGLMGTESQFGKMEEFWMVGMFAQQCEKSLMSLNHPLKMAKTVNFMLCVLYHNKNILIPSTGTQ